MSQKERIEALSTRGAVARWTNKESHEWFGRYHHWDSYPTGLGATLYELVKSKRLGDLERTLLVLIDEHPAGWSTINGAVWGQKPGYEDSSKEPCRKCGRCNWEHYAQSYRTARQQKRLEAILATLPADKAERIRRKEEFLLWHRFEHDYDRRRRPQCYCHGSRDETPSELTQSNAAGSGVEWVYVFDVRCRTMTVLEAVAGGQHSVGMFGMGDPDASWLERAVVFLDNPEPNWKAFES